MSDRLVAQTELRKKIGQLLYLNNLAKVRTHPVIYGSCDKGNVCLQHIFTLQFYLHFRRKHVMVARIQNHVRCVSNNWESRWVSEPGRARGGSGGGGGVGYSTTFHTARFRPEIQPLTLSYTFFSQKRYPFRIPSIKKCYPFHIPTQEYCVPIVNPWDGVRNVSYEGKQASSITGKDVTGPKQKIPKRWISLPFHILQLVESLPFCIPTLLYIEKDIPVGRSLPV